MDEFGDRYKKLPDYRSTPFARRRNISVSDLLVCRRTAHEILTSGFQFACGEYAASFMAVLNAGGLRSRLVKLVGAKFDDSKYDIGHDMVEVSDPATGRWVLTDPTMARVYRDYERGLYFSAYGHNWIRIGTYESNWEAVCFSREDSTRLRVEGMEKHGRSKGEFPELR